MSNTPAEPKKFDAITFIGLALALLIFFWNMQHQSQLAQQRAAAAQAQAQAAAAQAAQQAKGPPSESGVGTSALNNQNTTVTVKTVAEAPPIKVDANGIELEFSSRGGVIKSAKLTGVFEDAHLKNVKGLEIISEIMTGRCAFGIPKFDIRPHAGMPSIMEDSTIPLRVDGKPGPSLDSTVWEVTDSGSFDAQGIRTIAYSLTIDKYVLRKTFTLSNNDEFVRCDLAVENHSDVEEDYFYWLNGPQGILMDDNKIAANRNGRKILIQSQLALRDTAASGQTAGEPEVVQYYADPKKKPTEDIGHVGKASGEMIWGTVKNRFFMATLISLDPKQLKEINATAIQYVQTQADVDRGDRRVGDDRFIDPNISIVGLRYDCTLAKGTAHSDPYALYLGPADDNHLDRAEASLKTVMTAPSDYHLRSAIQFFEMFSWRWNNVDRVARAMMWVFQGLYKLFSNYGIAVVLMTLLIKACLHPLTRKSMKSMSEMQKLAPELAKIKEKYKNQTGSESQMKMHAEQQDVMRKAGVNPAAGCLPMFIQMPVFSSLYGIFYHAYDMRGAPFLWIKDLSQPDQFYTIKSLIGASSWIPSTINLLPLLYIVLSVVQTRLAPQPVAKSDDPQAEMNRKMMMFMPVMISFMFYSMPAGLVLYFTVSALWGMLESWYIKKFVVKSAVVPALAATTSGGGSSGSKVVKLSAKPSR